MHNNTGWLFLTIHNQLQCTVFQILKFHFFLTKGFFYCVRRKKVRKLASWNIDQMGVDWGKRAMSVGITVNNYRYTQFIPNWYSIVDLYSYQ
jgi:hypothetical protein